MTMQMHSKDFSTILYELVYLWSFGSATLTGSYLSVPTAVPDSNPSTQTALVFEACKDKFLYAKPSLTSILPCGDTVGSTA